MKRMKARTGRCREMTFLPEMTIMKGIPPSPSGWSSWGETVGFRIRTLKEDLSILKVILGSE